MSQLKLNLVLFIFFVLCVSSIILTIVYKLVLKAQMYESFEKFENEVDNENENENEIDNENENEIDNENENEIDNENENENENEIDKSKALNIVKNKIDEMQEKKLDSSLENNDEEDGDSTVEKKNKKMENFDNSKKKKSSCNTKDVSPEISQGDTLVVQTASTKQNSKIGSSLEFSYITDSSDSQVLTTNSENKYPMEISAPFPGPGPKIPIVSSCKIPDLHEQRPQKKNNTSIEKEQKRVNNYFYNSEKHLAPDDSIDSPYGFVFFPNKYWKQWSTKPPVCVPTNPCKVQPIPTSGVPVDVLDYTQIGSIMPKFEYKEEYS
jgi:hypothetical protein